MQSELVIEDETVTRTDKDLTVHTGAVKVIGGKKSFVFSDGTQWTRTQGEDKINVQGVITEPGGIH